LPGAIFIKNSVLSPYTSFLFNLFNYLLNNIGTCCFKPHDNLFAMKTAKLYSILLMVVCSVTGGFAPQGVIQGRIYNANNNEPVEFAIIAIYGTSIGSISDLDGNFLFTGLEPGYVKLRVSSVGFETYVSEAIEVTNARKVFMEIPNINHFAAQGASGGPVGIRKRLISGILSEHQILPLPLTDPWATIPPTLYLTGVLTFSSFFNCLNSPFYLNTTTTSLK